MNLEKSAPWAQWLCHTIAGYITLFALFWVPLGLHRIVMREKGWWHYPASFLIGLLGLLGWHYIPSRYWIFLAAPYFYLLTRDFWTLWLWTWPQEQTPLDHLQDLNKRYELSGHLAMGIVLFVCLVLVMGEK